jgi:hypothetical protein
MMLLTSLLNLLAFCYDSSVIIIYMLGLHVRKNVLVLNLIVHLDLHKRSKFFQNLIMRRMGG